MFLNNTILSVVFLILLATNAGAILIAYYLYKWRKRTQEGDKLIVVPDEFLKLLDSNNQEIYSLKTSHQKDQDKIVKSVNEITYHSKSSNKQIIDFLRSIQKLAEERSLEIERYRDGYDYLRLKIFVINIIRIIDQVNDSLREDTTKKEELHDLLEDIRDDLLILLENNNIKQILPEKGQPYSPETRDYKVITRIIPDEPHQQETIKDILKPGYRLIISDSVSKVIREAEVEIYNKLTKARESDA